jgi:hypothetical protein
VRRFSGAFWSSHGVTCLVFSLLYKQKARYRVYEECR